MSEPQIPIPIQRVFTQTRTQGNLIFHAAAEPTCSDGPDEHAVRLEDGQRLVPHANRALLEEHAGGVWGQVQVRHLRRLDLGHAMEVGHGAGLGGGLNVAGSMYAGF
jgi:hypothetical protein